MGADVSRCNEMGADASKPFEAKLCCAWRNASESVVKQYDDVHVMDTENNDPVLPRVPSDEKPPTQNETQDLSLVGQVLSVPEDQNIAEKKVDWEIPEPEQDPGGEQKLSEVKSLRSTAESETSSFAPRPSLPSWTDLQDPGESELLMNAHKTIGNEVDHALRVCVLGGKFRKQTDDEERLVPVLQAICQSFEKRPDLHVHLVTGGLEGVQRAFSQNVGENFKSKLVHLKSADMGNHIEEGTEIHVCEKKEDKAEIMANIGSVYILVSGGPGVADEARKALDRGAIVLPFIFTGGASAFQYPSFPEMDKPSYITKKQWNSLRLGPGEEAAEAAVEIVQAVATKKKRKQVTSAVHAAVRLSRKAPPKDSVNGQA